VNGVYPKIGFTDSYFAEDLLPGSERPCGGTFRGACDADLLPRIAKRAAQINGPRFVYWLTLNTHVPVAPGDALTNFSCASGERKFATVAVCQMAELWRDLFMTVADLALDPSIAPAEILVVGDHAPPLWSKRSRGEFEPGQVAWYRLTPRAIAK
jgi:phosphoglycerol transferase MdoB-like AlkP superfamily enzyme